MSGSLFLPRRLANAQMSNSIVFWYSAKLDHIMCPPSPLAPPPSGYQKIECRHAHEVDKWSGRLTKQEQRLREMNDEERYNFEEPIRAHMLAELKANLKKSKDPVNKMFLDAAISNIERKREKIRKERLESFMHVEAKEGLAP